MTLVSRGRFQRSCRFSPAHRLPEKLYGPGLAHPVKQSMLAPDGVIPAPGEVFGRELLRVVAGKFNVNERTGQVEGYGKKWL
jgi:hypothetical protein